MCMWAGIACYGEVDEGIVPIAVSMCLCHRNPHCLACERKHQESVAALWRAGVFR
jgi:hypothetical protein